MILNMLLMIGLKKLKADLINKQVMLNGYLT
jgi:hypothetical protein